MSSISEPHQFLVADPESADRVLRYGMLIPVFLIGLQRHEGYRFAGRADRRGSLNEFDRLAVLHRDQARRTDEVELRDAVSSHLGSVVGVAEEVEDQLELVDPFG